MSDSRIKSFSDRINRLMDDRDDVGSDIRDVYQEVKSAGYKPRALRKVIADQRRKADPEHDAEVERYRVALGLAVEAVKSGEMSARAAAKVYGIGKTSVYKELAVRDLSAVEMTADDLGEWLPPHDEETGEPPCEMTADDLGDFLLIKRRFFREEIGDTVRRLIVEKGIKVSAQDPIMVDRREFDEIAGPIPEHLRRIPA